MPGLAQLKAGAAKIDVRYSALPDGAQIRYTAKDPKLVMALINGLQHSFRTTDTTPQDTNKHGVGLEISR